MKIKKIINIKKYLEKNADYSKGDFVGSPLGRFIDNRPPPFIPPHVPIPYSSPMEHSYQNPLDPFASEHTPIQGPQQSTMGKVKGKGQALKSAVKGKMAASGSAIRKATAKAVDAGKGSINLARAGGELAGPKLASIGRGSVNLARAGGKKAYQGGKALKGMSKGKLALGIGALGLGAGALGLGGTKDGSAISDMVGGEGAGIGAGADAAGEAASGLAGSLPVDAAGNAVSAVPPMLDGAGDAVSSVPAGGDAIGALRTVAPTMAGLPGEVAKAAPGAASDYYNQAGQALSGAEDWALQNPIYATGGAMAGVAGLAGLKHALMGKMAPKAAPGFWAGLPMGGKLALGAGGLGLGYLGYQKMLGNQDNKKRITIG